MPSPFTNVDEQSSSFVAIEDQETTTFYDIGDNGTIVIVATGYGEGPYGEGPYGGSTIVVNNNAQTIWTNIETP